MFIYENKLAKKMF